MTRFLITTLFALSLFVGGVSMSVSTVFAQQDTCTGGQVWDEIIGTCVEPAADGDETLVDDAESGKKATELKLGGEMGWLMTRLMSLFAWFVGIAAVTLDATVFYTVLQMGSFINELSAIGLTWSIIRDIGNIALIFGFLVAGISTILDSSFYGGGRKLIPTLIIVAVSLNFSLFVAEAVIDTGNLFATQIYKAINVGENAGEHIGDLIENPTQASQEGVAGVIMAQLGLQEIYGETLTNGEELFGEDTTWLVAFMSMGLFAITAFVMFSLAFMLITRFVILIFVIITSPIGFIGYAIPPLQSKAKQWWDMLINQTLTAPVMMLMLYIALQVITTEGFFDRLGGSTKWTELVTDPTKSVGILLSFFVAMGLLLAVNVVAKELSAFGASGAMKLAGKASFGVAAYGMRQTVGRGFKAASKKFNASSLSRVPGVGRAVSGALGLGAKASFDVRGTGLLNKLPGGGIDAGKAHEGGFSAMQKAGKEATKAYDTETRIGRLKKAIGKGDAPETNKIMRSLTDEEIQSTDLLDLIQTNTIAVQALTGHQASILPDVVIKKSSVYSNLSPSQLEAIRTGGHMSAASARTIGLLTLQAANPIFDTWAMGRTPAQWADLVAFWG